MYENFLDDPSEYHRAGTFWCDLVEEVATEVDQVGEWTTRMVATYVNGTPLPIDGNPLYAAVSQRRQRAVRIIQEKPIADETNIVAYLDTTFAGRSLQSGPVDELVIWLALSEESAAVARVLLRAWMSTSTSLDDMKTLIQKCAPPQ